MGKRILLAAGDTVTGVRAGLGRKAAIPSGRLAGSDIWLGFG